MLDIYAHTFMTATRTNCVKLREIPRKRKWVPRWLSQPPARCVDLDKL